MTMANSSTYLSDLFGLAGKRALVTGGTRGIGRGLAIALASAGADICLAVRDPSASHVLSVTAEIEALGRHVLVCPCDLANREDILSLVPHVCSTLGYEIDILVLCGGIQHRSPAESFPDAAWDNVLNVNLTAGFTLSREFAKHWLGTSLRDGPKPGAMKKIIFIASVTTFTGSIQIPAYTASKAAIGGLTKALSNEWTSKGINVNAIAPGYIATDLTSALRQSEGVNVNTQKENDLLARVPAGRWGLPEDLAGAVVHLAARSSDFISGETHIVDGGFCGR